MQDFSKRQIGLETSRAMAGLSRSTKTTRSARTLRGLQKNMAQPFKWHLLGLIYAANVRPPAGGTYAAHDAARMETKRLESLRKIPALLSFRLKLRQTSNHQLHQCKELEQQKNEESDSSASRSCVTSSSMVASSRTSLR